MNPPLLHHVLPELAEELTHLLVKNGYPELAKQVASLLVTDRCRCTDRFCAMFYTTNPPGGWWGPGHDNIDLEPDKGMLILDVVNGSITAVECLYRPAIRQHLLRLFPEAPESGTTPDAKAARSRRR